MASRMRPSFSVASRGQALVARVRHTLARPVDAASLGAFRIWFGLCLAVEVYRFYANDWITRYYVTPALTFPLPGFGFLAPWPAWGMYVHFAVLGVAAVAVAAGWLYRPAICVVFLGFTYVFLLEEANYLNHFYLISLLAFLLALMPADRWGVLQLARAPDSQGTGGGGVPEATVPYWTIAVLRAQLFLVYFYAGVAKLNPDWLRGQPMALWLAGRDVLGIDLGQRSIALLASYGSLLFDLSVGFLLLWPRTRAFGLVGALLFHCANMLLFQIGIFPWLAMGATLVFCEPGWPRRVIARLRYLLAGVAPGAPASCRSESTDGAPLAWGRTAFLAGYLAVQTLVPFRHWLYAGEVNWTEEGHILSWHMKLRDKTGNLRSFVAIHPQTGERVAHDPRGTLTERQYVKMVTRPRLVLRYVHWMAAHLEQEWGVRPRVYVDLWATLNGRPYQPLIDSSVDLAAVSMGLGPSSWIVPLRSSAPDPAVTDFRRADAED